MSPNLILESAGLLSLALKSKKAEPRATNLGMIEPLHEL